MSTPIDTGLMRITTIDGDAGHRLLRVEGVARGQALAALRSAIQENRADGAGVALDLSRVTFIDEEGLDLIRRLERQGVAIGDCSPFVLELLRGSQR